MSATNLQIGTRSTPLGRPVARGWIAIALIAANLSLPTTAAAQTGGTQGGFQPPTLGGGQTGGGSNQTNFPTLPSVTSGQGTAPATQVPGATPSMLYPSEDFRLSPGDLINVRLFLVENYNATVRVGQDGNAHLPLIGNVNLQGLTVREAQALIAQKLSEGGFYRQPEVLILVLDTVNGSVLITGEMHAQVPVTNERSLREVLLYAGGLPANASHTIKIVRPGLKQPIVVDLGTDLASSAAANEPVRPRDIIQVTRANVVYLLGAFLRQGAIPLDQATPLTLLQAASLSGGINFEGKNPDLRIIRTVGNERKVVSVNIRKIRDGKDPDPILQANDIVFLPTDNMKAVLKSLGVGGVLGLVSLVYAIRNY
jgi:polysaccharide export outer membrane protein